VLENQTHNCKVQVFIA